MHHDGDYNDHANRLRYRECSRCGQAVGEVMNTHANQRDGIGVPMQRRRDVMMNMTMRVCIVMRMVVVFVIMCCHVQSTLMRWLVFQIAAAMAAGVKMRQAFGNVKR